MANRTSHAAPTWAELWGDRARETLRLEEEA